jgi:hypothetical protein
MVDVADIFRAAWPAYLAKFGRLIPPEQRAAARAILRCRTPALGGQLYRCDCGKEHYTYHSCNHRACPKCGYDDNALWLAKQQARLLPVPYFLLTFTVPQELREPIRSAMRLWYGALLKESAGALQDVAAHEKYLGAQLGLIAILQTWTRDLRFHPHVHLLVPGAGLSADGLHWKRFKRPDYFLPQNRLAARLKGRLMAWLKREQPQLLARVPPKVWWTDWVPDIQPVGSGAAALKYLAAYVCRGPLHPSRILSWDGTHILFSYRDNTGIQHTSKLHAQEFLRRLLQHVPPRGFQRVRHYGWLSTAAKAKWHRILALLDWKTPLCIAPTPAPHPPRCPICSKPMRLIGTLPRCPP